MIRAPNVNPSTETRGCDEPAPQSQQPWGGPDLLAQSESYRGTGGCSSGNRILGFGPAFLDTDTGIVYCSCFLDGSPAPFHLLDGLPDDVVLCRSESGQVTAVKGSLVSGFVRYGKFYTRDEAAAVVDQITASAA
jgi:hypothetical protein